MQPSVHQVSYAERREAQMILQDLTNLKISDRTEGKTKRRVSVLSTETNQVEENTDPSRAWTVGVTKTFEDIMHSQYYPCDIKNFNKRSHLFSRDYIGNIANALAQNEEKYLDLFPDPHYFSSQSDIRPGMRSILFS